MSAGTGATVTEAQYRLLSAGTLLVVDLELTCGPGITADIQDIIQVGIVPMVMGVPPELDDTTHVWVRPQRSPVTSFCTKLTGITPANVARALLYQDLSPSLAKLNRELGPDAWASWGPDHLLIEQQNQAFGTTGPFADIPHLDIRRLVTPLIYQLTGLPRPKGSSAGVGLQTALTALGLDFVGQPHNAAADALNAARVLHGVRRRLNDLADRAANDDPDAPAGPPPARIRRKPTLH